MGTWGAQLLRPLPLDSSSGHDLQVVGSSPELGSVLSRESAPDPSPSVLLPVHKLTHVLSQINKSLKNPACYMIKYKKFIF